MFGRMRWLEWGIFGKDDQVGFVGSKVRGFSAPNPRTLEPTNLFLWTFIAENRGGKFIWQQSV